jgi:hypothetical protein
MIEATKLGSIFLIGNSLFLIGLILNQNESGKQRKRFLSNPLETITWICFLFQLFLLVINLKLTDF